MPRQELVQARRGLRRVRARGRILRRVRRARLPGRVPRLRRPGRLRRARRGPWVCNGCRKNRYGCNRPNRYVYDAEVAQKASDERRSDSRKGIDMPREKAEVALAHIKDGLSRGLSPYEISVLYEDVVGVHRSTIYRWVDAGYGGLTNLELERKVGFKPRDRKAPRKPTTLSPKCSHGEFEKLPGERKGARTEPDSVVGRAVDAQAVLTLYNLPDRSVAMSAVLSGASKSRNGLPSFSNKIVDTWTCAYEPLSRKMTVAWSP